MKEEAKEDKPITEVQFKPKELNDDFKAIYSIPKENYEDLKSL